MYFYLWFAIPYFEDKASCAVFAEFLLFFFFEDVKGFAREVGTPRT
jgi:hypothetical protein